MKCKQKKTREAVTLLAPVMHWAIFSEGVKKYEKAPSVEKRRPPFGGRTRLQ